MNRATHTNLNHLSDLCFSGLCGKYVRLNQDIFDQPILTRKLPTLVQGPLCDGVKFSLD